MFDPKTGALIDTEEVSRNERNQDKALFYQEMGKRGFDFEDIDPTTMLPKSLIPVVNGDFEPFVKFNNAIMDIHRKKLVSITDAIVYLTEDYFEPKQILKMLMTINLNYLQNDLRAKYKINQTEVVNKFLDFIY